MVKTTLVRIDHRYEVYRGGDLMAEGSSTLGRAGLLTHSYMMGPEGDSNGCVSIREYERFRKAFDDGEITRLVVVPSIGAVQAAQRTASQS